MCGYYGHTMHSSFGTFAKKFPPKFESDDPTTHSTALMVVSILSYVLILGPPFIGAFLAVVFTINPVEGNMLIPTILVIIYVVALIYPSIILKKKIIPAVCTT